MDIKYASSIDNVPPFGSGEDAGITLMVLFCFMVSLLGYMKIGILLFHIRWAHFRIQIHSLFFILGADGNPPEKALHL